MDIKRSREYITVTQSADKEGETTATLQELNKLHAWSRCLKQPYPSGKTVCYYITYPIDTEAEAAEKWLRANSRA